jgi:hypothetical protein
MSTKATSGKSRSRMGRKSSQQIYPHREIIEGGGSHTIRHKLGTDLIVVSLNLMDGSSAMGRVVVNDKETVVVRPGFFSAAHNRWVDIKEKVVVYITFA